MSTRYYFPSSGAADVSPAISSVWDLNLASPSRLRMVKGTKSGTPMTTLTVSSAQSVNGQDTIIRQYVSDPIGAQTITGSFLAQIRVSESSLGSNYESQIVVRVVSNDGFTVRGILYAGDTSLVNDAHEWPRQATVGLQNRQFPKAGSTSVSSVTAQNGDRIVVELGNRGLNSLSVAGDGNMRFGDTGATDLPQDETTTADNVPWIEFSFNISDGIPPYGAAYVPRVMVY